MAGWTNNRELVPLMCPNIDAHIAFSFLGIRGAYLFSFNKQGIYHLFTGSVDNESEPDNDND